MVLDAGDDHEITGSLEIGGTTATAGSLKIAGSTGNLMGGIFRVGANVADQKIGRMLVHDDGVIKASISAKGKSFINGTSGTGTTGTFFGINTDDPSAALHIVGDTLITGKLTVTSITSSMITSSILVTSGSNIFGDDGSDSHLFRGAITASSNISASGIITALSSNIVTINGGSF